MTSIYWTLSRLVYLVDPIRINMLVTDTYDMEFYNTHCSEYFIKIKQEQKILRFKTHD